MEIIVNSGLFLRSFSINSMISLLPRYLLVEDGVLRESTLERATEQLFGMIMEHGWVLMQKVRCMRTSVNVVMIPHAMPSAMPTLYLSVA